jgi:tRNA dimethylallyltransferase
VAVALRHSPEDHRRRIERRVADMLEQGLLEEVAALASEAPFALESGRAIGYAESLAYLAGQLDRESLVETMVRRTARLVRKQGTFLRSFDELRWIDVQPDETVDELVSRVEQSLEL